MKVSIIICTYQLNRYNDLIEALNSLKSQSYNNLEIVVVVDGNNDLYKFLEKHEIEIDKLILNEKNVGLSQSRNKGIAASTGDIIAFLDDDAIADKNWISKLVRMYEKYDAVAAGGKILPKWFSTPPLFLPEEYYWLIGATHKGFPEEITEVRNTFGSNISFKANIIRELGGFVSKIGVKGKGLLQAEEAELCERMKDKFGKGVVYNPNAIVYHKIFPERLKLKFLLRRAFWQGYSKQIIKTEGSQLSEESSYAKDLMFKSIPQRIVQIFFLIIFTLFVACGYFYGRFFQSNE